MALIQNSMFDNVSNLSPLADRVRPRNLDEFIGQEHILGKGKVLRQSIESDNISSMILWGPPGVGKTTLAMIIAEVTHANFMTFSAVTSGIKEIKDVMTKAADNRLRSIRTVLFVDEIHRFNKSQQDAFLPHVEKGNITFEEKITNMQCLPDNLIGHKYSVPTNQGVEKSIKERLEYIEKLKQSKKSD